MKRHLFGGVGYGSSSGIHSGYSGHSGSYSTGYNGIYEGSTYLKPEITTIIKQKIPFPVPVDRPVPYPVAGENSTQTQPLPQPQPREASLVMQDEAKRETNDKYMEVAIRLMLELILFLM